MDLTLYHCVIQHLSEPPDLAIIQNKQPMPEDWPVVLQSIDRYRKTIESFSVTEGKNTVTCIATLPEVYDKIAALEIGNIVHLIGCETVFDDKRKAYILDVQDVFTLKEYDDLLQERKKAEEERLAWLREEGYLESSDSL
jgi:hypothetical protein